MGHLPQSARAFAPACVGNVAVGFDFLGHTLVDPRDWATVRRVSDPSVRITAIRGMTTDIPLTAEDNTAGVALIALRHRLDLSYGFDIELDKGIPLASGMGGSAASCVAALVAANALLEHPVSQEILYQCALDAESTASGARNGDNVGPLLTGGLAICTPEHLVPLPVPPELYCVLVHPALQIRTRQARERLEQPFPLNEIVHQTTNLALVISGCFRNDFDLIQAGLSDWLIEPRRAELIPGFHDVKCAALDFSALGAGISGSGPSIFAWFRSQSDALLATEQMQQAFACHGIDSRAWLSPVAGPAATLIQSGRKGQVVP